MILFVYVGDAFSSDPKNKALGVQAKCERFLKDWKEEKNELPIKSVKQRDWHDLATQLPLGGKNWSPVYSQGYPVVIIYGNLKSIYHNADSLALHCEYGTILLDRAPLDIRKIAFDYLSEMQKRYKFESGIVGQAKKYIHQMSDLEVWQHIISASLDDLKSTQKTKALDALLNMVFVKTQYITSSYGEEYVSLYQSKLPGEDGEEMIKRNIITGGRKILTDQISLPKRICNFVRVFEKGSLKYALWLQTRNMKDEDLEIYKNKLSHLDMAQKSAILLGLDLACENFEYKDGAQIVKRKINVKKKQSRPSRF